MTPSDIIALIAAIISIFSLYFTYHVVLFTKRLEMRSNKFQKLILNELDLLFNSIDQIFKNNKDDTLSSWLNHITDRSVDITLYLIEAKNHFPEINPNQIQDELNSFTDHLYDNSMSQLNEHEQEYKRSKLNVMGMIYEQSIEDKRYFLTKWIK